MNYRVAQKAGPHVQWGCHSAPPPHALLSTEDGNQASDRAFSPQITWEIVQGLNMAGATQRQC